MIRTNALVQGVERHGSVVLLTLQASEIARLAEPGQFVHVLCGADSPRLLRRPFSIYSVEGNNLRLLFREVGSGTRWLRERLPDERVDLLGPLGRGFEIVEAEAPVLVAGGTGIAPLHFLGRRLKERGYDPLLFWGMDKRKDFGDLPGILNGEFQLFSCSMDGELDEGCTVLELFLRRGPARPGAIYACGPGEMLRQLALRLDLEGVFVQVCVEERMACGVGACQGCAIPAAGEEGGYLRTCKDGPVFAYSEIDWGEGSDKP
jgi:dihydroorotate dehydrogenase electron transfer subunit